LLTPDFFPTLFGNIGLIALYAVIGAVLMYAGYFAIDLTTPGDLRGLVREGRPNAVVVSASGLVSMALILVVALIGLQLKVITPETQLVFVIGAIVTVFRWGRTSSRVNTSTGCDLSSRARWIGRISR